MDDTEHRAPSAAVGSSDAGGKLLHSAAGSLVTVTKNHPYDILLWLTLDLPVATPVCHLVMSITNLLTSLVPGLSAQWLGNQSRFFKYIFFD